MSLPEWGIAKDVGLLLLALYGAILSTFNWRQALKKERRQIKVSLTTAIPTDGPKLGPTLAVVEATNLGQRPVHIVLLALQLEDGRRIFPIVSHAPPGLADTKLPITLADGETARRYFSYQGIGEALSGEVPRKLKLWPVCEDSAKSTYKGEPWDVDPAEFVRM